MPVRRQKRLINSNNKFPISESWITEAHGDDFVEWVFISCVELSRSVGVILRPKFGGCFPASAILVELRSDYGVLMGRWIKMEQVQLKVPVDRLARDFLKEPESKAAPFWASSQLPILTRECLQDDSAFVTVSYSRLPKQMAPVTEDMFGCQIGVVNRILGGENG